MLGSADVLLFEGFRLDRGGLCRLDQAGLATPITLGSRALDLLALLVKRHGQLVSKDQIMEAVWPGTAVEGQNPTGPNSALRPLPHRGRAAGGDIHTAARSGHPAGGPLAP